MAGRCRDQFTLDMAVTPGRILLRQAQHQRPDRRSHRRTPRPVSGVGPRARDQVVMPTQHGGRGEEERGPAWAWKEAGQGREYRSVNRFQIQPFDLTA